MKLVVANDPYIQEAVIIEAHKSNFAITLCSTKMYHNFRQYCWRGMKRDVALFYMIRQQVKAKQ